MKQNILGRSQTYRLMKRQRMILGTLVLTALLICFFSVNLFAGETGKSFTSKFESYGMHSVYVTVEKDGWYTLDFSPSVPEKFNSYNPPLLNTRKSAFMKTGNPAQYLLKAGEDYEYRFDWEGDKNAIWTVTPKLQEEFTTQGSLINLSPDQETDCNITDYAYYKVKFSTPGFYGFQSSMSSTYAVSCKILDSDLCEITSFPFKESEDQTRSVYPIANTDNEYYLYSEGFATETIVSKKFDVEAPKTLALGDNDIEYNRTYYNYTSDADSELFVIQNDYNQTYAINSMHYYEPVDRWYQYCHPEYPMEQISVQKDVPVNFYTFRDDPESLFLHLMRPTVEDSIDMDAMAATRTAQIVQDGAGSGKLRYYRIKGSNLVDNNTYTLTVDNASNATLYFRFAYSEDVTNPPKVKYYWRSGIYDEESETASITFTDSEYSDWLVMIVPHDAGDRECTLKLDGKIKAKPSQTGSCGENVSWQYYPGEKLLTVTGKGAMKDYGGNDCTELSKVLNALDIEKIEVGEGVTHIGNYAFYYMDKTLLEVVLPQSLTSIGKSAFDTCMKLTNINIPSGVTQIGQHAFSSCRSLNSLTIPDGVTKLEDGVFSHCAFLTELVLPKKLESIGSSCFNSMDSLKTLTIPEGVTEIPSYAVAFCNSLESVSIPSSVKSIGQRAFTGCNMLKEITIPNGVTEIGPEAFDNCKSLVKVVVPDSVTKIGYNSWMGGYYCAFAQSPNVVIYCGENSAAHNHALKYKLTYVLVDAKGNVIQGPTNPGDGTDNQDGGDKQGGNGDQTDTTTGDLVPAKVSLQKSSVKSTKAGVMSITWKAVKKASGYQIQYALDKKFKKSKKSKNSTKTKLSVKKLKKGKTYFVRIRAYTKGKNGKQYGAWSTIKKVKIKK
ncbi:MAG: fibronectin type III domain-containing protein [Lachnospiraceae bacterium]|nr:fibronectin type III domain-containing protein [Lachnospiraceae bacterium]